MTYPTAPSITYSYTGFQVGQGNNAFPGTQMDNDLATFETFASNVVDFMKLFANSDGTLKVSAYPDAAALASYVGGASVSATAAAGSASAAATSASAASTSATNAGNSATAAAASATSITTGGYLQASGNLAGLANVATARTNLGLGTFATKSSLVIGDVPDGTFTADATGRAKFAAGFADFSVVANGAVLQTVDSQSGAVATGTTVIPNDDTVPTSAEGDQYLSVTITPKLATSILEVEAVLHLAHSAGSGHLAAALFQDSGTAALAAGYATFINAGYVYQVRVRHRIVSGTTSATTFKVRAGCSAAGTTTFNGTAGGRTYGGVLSSSINVREIKA